MKPLHYSTGEVATITGLSQQTIIRCVDRGDLPAFRIPFSRFRRVSAAGLREWMVRRGIPLDRIDPCPADSPSS